MKTTFYSFAKHCMADFEFNHGGIPSKEKYYLYKLDLTMDHPDLAKFYEAMDILLNLQEKYEEGNTGF